MKIKNLLSVFTALFMMSAVALPPALADDGTNKVNDAVEVFKNVLAIPEKGIPPTLLSDAYGIAIIPGVIKLGFMIGGRYGTGILVVRDSNGRWSNPGFVSLAGGGIGWQMGAQSTDIILVFKNRKSIDGIMKGKFTLGADAAIAAGPVGRSAAAATDVTLKSEIYSYSRSRGLFAGVSLEGAALQIDDDANNSFYGKQDIRIEDIFSGKVTSQSPAVKDLERLLKEYAGI